MARLASIQSMFRRALLGVVLASTVSFVQAADAPFKILSAHTQLVNKVYHLSTELEFTLSKDIIAALDNGVPIVLALDVKITRERSYIWEKTLASLTQRYQLQYHALSEQYILRNLNSGAQSNYASLYRALAELKSINDLPLVDSTLLLCQPACIGNLRLYVALETLPTPLLLTAYFSSSWRLGSEWYRWNLVTNSPVE